MQESESTPLAGGQSTSTQAPAVGGGPYPQRSRDPVTRWLIVTIFMLIALGLAAVLSALAFGMFNISGAPRTQVERDLAYYDAQIQSGKVNNQTVALYVDTLVRAGQLSKAQATLDQALKTAKSDRSYLFAEQAELSLASKKYEAALKSADKAMAEAKKELEAFKKRNLENKRKENAGAVMPDSYTAAALAKATALVALKDHARAIKVYDAYLKIAPTDSDILVLRAESRVVTGDKKGAEGDYRAALKFIPDYQPALDGLNEIGASQ